MLRSDTFNPAIRIKNAPDAGLYTEFMNFFFFFSFFFMLLRNIYFLCVNVRNNLIVIDTEDSEKKKPTPAEYRRMQGSVLPYLNKLD